MTLRRLHPMTLQEVTLSDEMRDRVISIWDSAFPKIGFIQTGSRLDAVTVGGMLKVEVFLQFGPDQDSLRFIFRHMGNAQFKDLVLGNPDWAALERWVTELRERTDNTIKDMQTWLV